MAAAVDSFQLLYAEICRSCSGYYEALALLGAVYAASKAVVLLRASGALVRVHVLPRLMPREKLSRRFGGWAVVYGAGDPVTRAYAGELARDGVSIVFVTEDESWEPDAAATLTRDHGVETLVVQADWSLDPADPAGGGKAVRDALRGRDVGFLVSGVGGPRLPPARLADVPERHLLDGLSRNVTGATLMARLVLPGMLRRGRGAVVNIWPGGCHRPTAGRAVLTAAAGYVDLLSRTLQLEYGASGIFVQSLTPLQISSSEQQTSRGSWLVPTAEVYAHHAVSTLGVSTRTTGYWPHTLQLFLMLWVPDWVWRLLVSSC